jgi:hypothetical protein
MVKQLVEVLQGDDAIWFWLAVGFVALMLLMVALSNGVND